MLLPTFPSHSPSHFTSPPPPLPPVRYSLLTEYNVAVPDADVASVKMMESSSGQVSHLVAQEGEKQEERTSNFTTDIDAQIESLRTKASELRQESDNPILFDGDTDMGEALALLATMQETFDEIKADSVKYESYQEILKVRSEGGAMHSSPPAHARAPSGSTLTCCDTRARAGYYCGCCLSLSSSSLEALVWTPLDPQ